MSLCNAVTAGRVAWIVALLATSSAACLSEEGTCRRMSDCASGTACVEGTCEPSGGAASSPSPGVPWPSASPSAAAAPAANADAPASAPAEPSADAGADASTERDAGRLDADVAPPNDAGALDAAAPSA